MAAKYSESTDLPGTQVRPPSFIEFYGSVRNQIIAAKGLNLKEILISVNAGDSPFVPAVTALLSGFGQSCIYDSLTLSLLVSLGPEGQ